MEIWTPKQQRSREKWRSVLAEFQYKNGYSREEMEEIFQKLSEEKSEETSPIKSEPTSRVVYNSADMVLKQFKS